MIELLTAVSSALEAPPPRLMFATAGFTWLAVTQLMPAMTPDVDPGPAAVQDAHREDADRLGHAARRAADRARDVRAVAVAVAAVAAVANRVDRNRARGRRTRVCVPRMPVSMTYTFTPLPVVV